MDEKELLEYTGILDRIELNKSDNPKAPCGFIYFVGLDRKITVWDKTTLDLLVEKGNYKIIYQHTQSNYGGRVFDNYTLSTFIDNNLNVDTNKLTFPKDYIEKVKESGFPVDKLVEGSGEIVWNLMGFPVKIDGGITEIKLPKKVLDYLINLKGMVGSKIEEDG